MKTLQDSVNTKDASHLFITPQRILRQRFRLKSVLQVFIVTNVVLLGVTVIQDLQLRKLETQKAQLQEIVKRNQRRESAMLAVPAYILNISEKLDSGEQLYDWEQSVLSCWLKDNDGVWNEYKSQQLGN